MPQYYFVGQDVDIQVNLVDKTGTPSNASAISVVVTDPTGATVSATTPTQTGATGHYEAIVSAVATPGTYTVAWSATVSTYHGVFKGEFQVRAVTSVPLVAPSDLINFIGTGAANLDTTRAQLILDSAQALCETIVFPLPYQAAAVVLDVAARQFINSNLQSLEAGPFSSGYVGGMGGGLYLTRQNRSTLRRMSGGSTAFSVDPTPSTAGTGQPPWDLNVDWYSGVPLRQDELQ